MLATNAVLVLIALTGCSEPAGESDEDVIVLSGNVVDANATAAPTASGKGMGHIAGFVVDDAVRPVEGATVTLPALDLTDVTDRDGRFEFVDLAPGAYLVRINATGHQEAEAFLEVEQGRFTRAKVILHRIPAPEPWRETWKGEGFAEVTQFGVLAISISGNPIACSCYWEPGLTGGPNTTAVIEIADDGYSSPGPGSSRYWVQMWGNGSVSEVLGSPVWLQVNASEADAGDARLQVNPWSEPLPETSKAFEVFVTVFHNEPVPDGYSVVAGRT